MATTGSSMLSGGLKSVESLERAQEHWRRRRQAIEAVAQADDASPPTAVTITISRESGTQATSVAREVGRRLGWLVYDQELIERIAQELGLRARLIESVDERHIGWIRETVHEAMQAVAGVPSISEDRYVAHLIETILSLGMHGECVIVGRGANFVLPPSSTLRVRLVAPLEARVAAVSRVRNLSEHEARAYIAQTDRERDRFLRDHFRSDPHDPRNFDLVLNAGHFSVADCGNIIEAALKDFRTH